jgi:hypothetical protein
MLLNNKEKTMTLAEYRAEWEKGGQAICTTVKQYTDEYKVVFAIIKYSDNSYALYRYFTLGSEWVLSADIPNATLEKCLAKMSDEFDEIYPTE